MTLEVIRTVGSISSAILAALTLSIFVLKPVRNFLIGWIKKTASHSGDCERLSEVESRLNENIRLFGDCLNSVNEKLDGIVVQNKQGLESSRTLLGNEIRKIYYDHLDKDNLSFTVRQKEYLVKLYDQYKALGGNHFIDEIFSHMMEWEVVF